MAVSLLAVGLLVATDHSDPAHAQGGRTIWDGVYTEDQAERGRGLYDEGCGECHGQGLEGGEMEPPLTGSEFMYAWNGLSVGDLFERLRISMPQGDPSSMSRQEKVDVIAYMLAENGLPAGDTELPRQTPALRTIAIEAVQP